MGLEGSSGVTCVCCEVYSTTYSESTAMCPELAHRLACHCTAHGTCWMTPPHGWLPAGMDPSPPDGFDTCLGDLFSVAWMEDSEWEDLTTETLKVVLYLLCLVCW